jgi:DNA-binding GntR family transcriptional regulator
MINVRYLAPMPEDVINPYADEPLYVQLAGIVRRMIQNGKLQHLDPLPSESSLVQTYGVSRDTARRAVARLRDEGVVFTVPHRGTYVGPRPGKR